MRIGRYILMVYLGLMLLASCQPNNKSQTQAPAQDTVKKAPEIQYDRYWNDLARYFAGMEPLTGSVLDSIDYRPEAIKHRAYIEPKWKLKDSLLLRPLAKWSQAEHPNEYTSAKSVFYPFSGPDFVTIHTLFPNAQKYVMFGLEIEGDPPQIKKIAKDRLPINIANLAKAVRSNLDDSFFYTLDMSGDLYLTDLKGTTPILMFFLARTGNEVLDVKRIKINDKGGVDYLAENDSTPHTPNDNIPTGVQIKFRKDKNAPVQMIEYFCFNAEDKSFQAQVPVHTYFQSLKPTHSYLKSASYLNHQQNFGIIRNIILDVSDSVTEDDTGIAYRYFDPNIWSFQYYGNYTRPIPLFAGFYQADLSNAYRQAGTAVKPLNFNMGYKSTTNLIIARKKNTGAAPSSATDNTKPANVKP
jgi:hypothetical protein